MTTNNNIIVSMATNDLVNNLFNAKCRRQVTEAIQLYLNRCFHVSTWSKSMKYDNTRVTVYFIDSVGIDIEFTSKDGTHYNWIIRCDEESAFGRTNYVTGYFSSTDFPPYVENVLWNLYEVLTKETGILQLDQDLEVR